MYDRKSNVESALFSTLNGEQLYRLPPAITVCSHRKVRINDEFYMRFRINKGCTITVYCYEIIKCMNIRINFLIPAYFYYFHRDRCLIFFCMYCISILLLINADRENRVTEKKKRNLKCRFFSDFLKLTMKLILLVNLITYLVSWNVQDTVF